MTTTADRIAAAIKDILAEDRREDRERIAQLERDLADAKVTISEYDAGLNEQVDMIADLNAKLDELTASKAPAKRIPQVGDKVRFVAGSYHEGTIGRLSSLYGNDAIISQRGLKYGGDLSDLEVIE